MDQLRWGVGATGHNHSTFPPGLHKKTLVHTVISIENIPMEILASLLTAARTEPEVLVQKWICQARQELANLLTSTLHISKVEEESR